MLASILRGDVMETLATVAGVVIGVALLSLAVGGKRRGVAVRVASGLSWLVLTVGLLAYSFFASAAWAWPAWNGLLIGGGLGVVLSVLEWLVKGAGAASSLASSDMGARLAAGVVVLVAGVGAWWFVGAESGPGEPAALVADGAAAAPMCFCSMNAFCVGPRGGVYCITDDGRKKYQKRGDK